MLLLLLFQLGALSSSGSDMFGERVGEFDFPGRSLEDVRIDARVRSALRTAVWDVVGVDVGAIALSER